MNTPRAQFWLTLNFATQASVIAVLVFVMCRGDHDMKLLALGAAISQTSSLMSTASTMLTGRDVTKHDVDLPPGSSRTASATETIRTPPIASNPIQPASEPA